MKKSMEMLQNETFTVSEVAFKVGFGSPAYFNKCFREYFGYTPGEVRKADPILTIRMLRSVILMKINQKKA